MNKFNKATENKGNEIVLKGPQQILSFINKYYKQEEISPRLTMHLVESDDYYEWFGKKYRVEIHVTTYSLVGGELWGQKAVFRGGQINALLTRVAKKMGLSISNIQGVKDLYRRGRDVTISFDALPLKAEVKEEQNNSFGK